MAVFRRRIRDKLNRAMSLRGEDGKVAAQRRVDQAKDLLMEIIDKDPVSERILNSSFTRGYFGLLPGGSEVEPLKTLIFGNTKVTSQKQVRFKGEKGISISYNIKYPTQNEIYSSENLSLPWTRKTWVEAAQQGLSNISRFLFSEGKGNSGFGIQLKKDTFLRQEIIDPDYLKRIRLGFSESLTQRGLRTKS